MINQPPLTHKANASNVFLYLSVVFTIIQLVTRPSPEMLKVVHWVFWCRVFAGISLLKISHKVSYTEKKIRDKLENETKRKQRSWSKQTWKSFGSHQGCQGPISLSTPMQPRKKLDWFFTSFSHHIAMFSRGCIRDEPRCGRPWVICQTIAKTILVLPQASK